LIANLLYLCIKQTDTGMTQKKNAIQRIQQFFFHDLWQLNTVKKTTSYRFLFRPLRIFFITFKGFFENKVQIRASALTYNTMLSIVPILALAFGIAQGFGMQRKLEAEIINQFHEQKEVLQTVLSFVRKMLNRVQGGVIAGVGVVLLLWTVMQVLGSIENAFNDIWQVKKARTLTRKSSDYLSIMLIAPIFLLASSSVTVFLSANIHTLMASLHLPEFFKWVTHVGLDLIPYILIWLTFTFVYMVFPNTKVKFSSGLIAGIIAGTTFQILQWGYFKFQIKLSNYGAIYGSFAALPLFMVWVQISWIVVLFGAELSYAVQNLEDFEQQTTDKKYSTRQRNIIALLVLNHIIKKFAREEKPESISQIGTSLDIPVRLTSSIIYELQQVNLITEVATAGDEENAYQPGVDIHIITTHYALEKFTQYNESTALPGQSNELKKIESIIASFGKELSEHKENILLKDL
jgi:membrane protein